ncbi:hypothetical protein NSQ54_10270 [Alkalihalobacillus sp. FSL W8-0930]
MIQKNFFINALITFAIILAVSILFGLIFSNASVGEILADRVVFAAIFAIVWTILQFAINKT